MSSRRLVKPTAREDRAINAGIARDPDTYELSAGEFKQLRPVLRGRPKAAVHKEPVNLRLSPEVLEFFRSTGRGWQTRIDAVLCSHAKRSKGRQRRDHA
jgi:uncharacterized protein (DUF4415 family)